MGILLTIAECNEPLGLAKEVEHDVMIKGLELNEALSKAKRKYDMMNNLADKLGGSGKWD